MSERHKSHQRIVIVVRVGDNLIESVITKKSADEMKLKKGDTVSAIIKSIEVMLEK